MSKILFIFVKKTQALNVRVWHSVLHLKMKSKKSDSICSNSVSVAGYDSCVLKLLNIWKFQCHSVIKECCGLK